MRERRREKSEGERGREKVRERKGGRGREREGEREEEREVLKETLYLHSIVCSNSNTHSHKRPGFLETHTHSIKIHVGPREQIRQVQACTGHGSYHAGQKHLGHPLLVITKLNSIHYTVVSLLSTLERPIRSFGVLPNSTFQFPDSYLLCRWSMVLSIVALISF